MNTLLIIGLAAAACAAIWAVADEIRSVRATKAWIERALAAELEPLDEEHQTWIAEDEEARQRGE